LAPPERPAGSKKLKNKFTLFLLVSLLALFGLPGAVQFRGHVLQNAPSLRGSFQLSPAWLTVRRLSPNAAFSYEGSATIVGTATEKLHMPDENPSLIHHAKPYYEAAFVIPEGTFPMNHGSSLVELDNGNVFITWFAGSEERASDVQIYSSTYRAKTHDYSRPSAVVRSGERSESAFWADESIGNTALFYDDEMVLWLFYNAIPIPYGGWSTAVVNYKVSYDKGQTWSRPKRLVNFFGNLMRNAPVRLQSDTFLIPLYTELFTHKGYVCRVKHFKGNIVSQNCEGTIDANGAIQPALALTQEGSLLMLLRDQAKKRVRRSWSYDHGQTWTPVDNLGLPNPNAAVTLTSLDDGRILLIYNDSADRRAPLSIAVSNDNGRSFRKIRDLEAAPGSFSYPAAIQTKDSLIDVTYSYNRKTIKHVRFNKEWMFAND
jgi:predicted neuraminidase